MRFIDFEYDGKLLSDYGFIVCNFNQSSGAEVADVGSEIVFEKTPVGNGKRFSLAGTKFENCVSAKFDLCKDPDRFDLEDMEITDSEFGDISRWLNRGEFLKLYCIEQSADANNAEQGADRIHFYASFNVAKITVASKLFGIELTMETNSPFGYKEQFNETFTFEGNDSNHFEDMSDHIGFIYPEVTIVCAADGNYVITDDLGQCSVEIDNCTDGETITMSGDTMIISSSNSAHDLANDFNYEFFRIGNTIETRDNVVEANLPCSITIKYEPFAKSTP